jgi:hypothetical protein
MMKEEKEEVCSLAWAHHIVVEKLTEQQKK